ncbi:gastrula zinc finger protein XlCGF52.1-like [Cydia amplana]|uniref:gastrula zinc finger protein XlCGF52.1-like n=1 Tax=Cydia amplana TaxID=1869771 RepID=UPI002FE6182F
MDFFLRSESEDEAKPFVTSVPIKGEPECETEDHTVPIACRPDLYDVHVKVEPLESLDIEVACLTEGTIKKESIIVDAEFEATGESHIVNSHGSQIEVCITKESCSSPTLDEVVVNKDFLKCRICQKVFDSNSSLTIHMLTHNKDKPSLKKKRNQNKGIITCKICHMQYTSSHTYCKHRPTHVFEKPFKCEFCEKAFNSKYLLTNHERTHTGEKPFLCDLCDKRFTEKVNLNRHKRSHSGAKPYRCNVCSNSFTCKQNLEAHMIWSHTDEKQWGFECQFCNKRWPNKNELRRHLRTHTGERPYSCDICKKSFKRKYYLVYHIRAHNNERPFACEICNKRFVNKHDCKKHLKIHMTKKK